MTFIYNHKDFYLKSEWLLSTIRNTFIYNQNDFIYNQKHSSQVLSLNIWPSMFSGLAVNWTTLQFNAESWFSRNFNLFCLPFLSSPSPPSTSTSPSSLTGLRYVLMLFQTFLVNLSRSISANLEVDQFPRFGATLSVKCSPLCPCSILLTFPLLWGTV